MFNRMDEATLRSYWGEQIAMASNVPLSLRQLTLEQERLRQGYVHRYALACIRLLMPKDLLNHPNFAEPPYPEFAADVAALRAYRKKHPLPRIPAMDDDRKLLEQFLHATQA
jgi:hypothetical protein